MNSSDQAQGCLPSFLKSGESEQERKILRLREQLKEFPHSFQMTDIDRKEAFFERVRGGLEAALKVGFKTPLETARARNLLSYCLFFLRMPEKAKQQAEQAMALDSICISQQKSTEIKPKNIVSLANKAFILGYMGYHEQAAEQVESLQDLKRDPDFQYMLIKAKGELAFSYTRMGPTFIPQAIRIFNEILPQAREEEGLLWKFGLALSYRRLIHIQNIEIISTLGSQEPWQVKQKILSLLKGIIEKSTSRNLRAKAYSELALLLNQDRKDVSLIKEAGVSIEEACNRALDLDGEDYSVLVKTGRLFRYMKKTELSCQLLEKALSLRPSSTMYHHLGLTYKALATDIIYKDSSNGSYHRGRGRGRGQQGQGERGRIWTQFGNSQGVRPDSRRGCGWRQMSPGYERHNSNESYTGRGHVYGRGRWQGTNNGSWRNNQLYRNKPDPQDDQSRQEHAEFYNPGLLGLGWQSVESRDDTKIKLEHNISVQFGAMSLETNTNSSHRNSQENLANDEITARDTLTQRDFGRMVKAPNGTETKFSMSDTYIPEAVKYFQMAVEFSKGENKRALYDLALINKALGKYEQALELLGKIRNTCPQTGAFDKVNAWEQTGLILKDMSKKETNETKRKQLDKDGEDMLRTALCEAMRLFSRTPNIQQYVCQVWHSFSTLLAEIDKSDSNIQDKFRKKAYLFHLVKKPNESISILQELQRLSPEDQNDPQTLKLLIENYADTGEYQTALIFINTLKCSSEGNPTMSLFEDKYYTQKVSIKAGKERLLGSSAELARPLFRAAFTDIISDANTSSASSSSDSWETSSSSDSEDLETWHVMLLFEEDMEKSASCLEDLLTDACGLDVTCMDNDVMPGSFREGVLRNMKKSQLLVFVVGKKISPKLKYFMDYAVERNSTVTLLLDTSKPPQLLSKHSYIIICLFLARFTALKLGHILREPQKLSAHSSSSFLAFETCENVCIGATPLLKKMETV